VNDTELQAEPAAIQREHANLEREHQILAEEPSRLLHREHAGSLLAHIDRLHQFITVLLETRPTSSRSVLLFRKRILHVGDA
jgi:hypothetical protein